MEELNDGAASATVDASFDGSGAVLVNLRGELDMASIPGVEAQIEELIQAAPSRVAFDMSAVTFMDSSGIAMLLRAAKRVEFLAVRKPSPPVQLVLRATGLSEVLHVDP
mgnify:CR=1 FL=1